MNVKEQLEFEPAYFDFSVQYVDHYVMVIPLKVLRILICCIRCKNLTWTIATTKKNKLATD